MAAPAPNWRASGNISPSVFVKIDTANNEHVLQATAGDIVVGVSSEETFYPQGVGNYDGYAAHQGNTIKVYGIGETALLAIGTGGCTCGDFLKSDANGNGVTVNLSTAATQTWYGARALETANAGDLARVLILPGSFTHP